MIHCQTFHELAMDYRSASVEEAAEAYKRLTAYIDSSRTLSSEGVQLAKLTISLLQDLMECFEIPEKNCHCHISPPCNDCVENDWPRETVKNAKLLVLSLQANLSETQQKGTTK